MAELVLVVGGVDIRSYPLIDGRAMIGRSSRAQIRLSDDTVSARHAVVEAVRGLGEASNSRYFLQDLCSTNGTALDGRRVRRAQLHDGDVIEVGWQRLRFCTG